MKIKLKLVVGAIDGSNDSMQTNQIYAHECISFLHWEEHDSVNHLYIDIVLPIIYNE